MVDAQEPSVSLFFFSNSPCKSYDILVVEVLCFLHRYLCSQNTKIKKTKQSEDEEVERKRSEGSCLFFFFLLFSFFFYLGWNRV